jgi:hypothetical protein
MPRKEHNFCHLCSMRYDDYNIHIKSDIHNLNLNRNKNNYDQLRTSFTRIQNQWKEKNDVNKINMSIPINNKIDEGGILCLNTNEAISTKFATAVNNLPNTNEHIHEHEHGSNCLEFKKEEVAEDKENMQWLSNIPRDQIKNEYVTNQIRNNKDPTPNDYFHKRKLNFTQFNSFESELTERNVKHFTRATLLQKKPGKEINNLLNTIHSLKNVISQSFSMNIK